MISAGRLLCRILAIALRRCGRSILPFASLYLVFGIILFISSVCWATTYYVKTTGNDACDGKSEPNAWKTIDHAIDTPADTNFTVNVAAGTYNEGTYAIGFRQDLNGGKTITIIGVDANTTIVRGNTYGIEFTDGVHPITSGNFTLQNLTIQQCGQSSAYLLRMRSGISVNFTATDVNFIPDVNNTVLVVPFYGDSSGPNDCKFIFTRCGFQPKGDASPIAVRNLVYQVYDNCRIIPSHVATRDNWNLTGTHHHLEFKNMTIPTGCNSAIYFTGQPDSNVIVINNTFTYDYNSSHPSGLRIDTNVPSYLVVNNNTMDVNGDGKAYTFISVGVNGTTPTTELICSHLEIKNNIGHLTNSLSGEAVMVGVNAGGGEVSGNQVFCDGTFQAAFVFKGSSLNAHDNLGVGSMYVKGSQNGTFKKNIAVSTIAGYPAFYLHRQNFDAGRETVNNIIIENIFYGNSGVAAQEGILVTDDIQSNGLNYNLYYTRGTTLVSILGTNKANLATVRSWYLANGTNSNSRCNDHYSISGDPCFVNSAAGDYNLATGSIYTAMIAAEEPNLVAYIPMDDNALDPCIAIWGHLDSYNGTYYGKDTVGGTQATYQTVFTDTNGQVLYTAVAAGTGGNVVNVKYTVKTGGGFRVDVVDNNVFVYKYPTDNNKYPTAQFISLLEANSAATALVSVSQIGDGNSKTNTVATQYSLSGGVDAGEVNATTHARSVAGAGIDGNNRALSFNGTSDYVDTLQTFQTTFDSNFMVSLWVEPNDGQPSASQYFCGISGGEEGDRSSFYIGVDNEGKVFGNYIISGTGVDPASGVVFNDGQVNAFHHIVFVVEQVGSKICGRLYFDGFLADEKTSNTDASMSSWNLSSPSTFVIGADEDAGSVSSYFSGSIDDVMIYNGLEGFNIADLNKDKLVNFSDFAVFAYYWMELSVPPDFLPSDLNKDGKVDVYDLQLFCCNWLWESGD